MRRDKLVDNKYVERFAWMCEGLKAEQKRSADACAAAR